MRVLMISGDAKALEQGSGVYQRLLLQAAEVGRLDVYVRGPHTDIPLGSHGGVHGFNTSKLRAALAMMHAGTCLEGVDVVTAQDPFFLGLIAWRIARRRKAKLELQLHTDLFAQPFIAHNPLKVLVARFLLRRADAVRVVSERLREGLMRQLTLRGPVFVLPVYINLDALRAAEPAPLREEYPQFSDIVLVASRLEPEKNVAAALRAMQEILHAFPNAGLLVAGEGSERRALEALAQELGIAEHTIFLGYRPDVFSLYKSADLLLNTSLYEGFGASVVEALAAGCPVVSTDVGVAREAGALVAPYPDLGTAAIQALRAGVKGELRLRLLDERAHAKAWRDALPQ